MDTWSDTPDRFLVDQFDGGVRRGDNFLKLDTLGYYRNTSLEEIIRSNNIDLESEMDRITNWVENLDGNRFHASFFLKQIVHIYISRGKMYHTNCYG